MDIYRQYADRLLQEGGAYRCYCTVEELEAKKRLFLKKGAAPRYDGACRNLTAEDEEQKKAEGRPAAIRFKIGQKEITFNDLVRGTVTFQADKIGDFIIVRSDGRANYNFCAAIDDALMKISHVFRGEDHLSNTPRQILIQQALQLSTPAYGHLSLIVGSDRTKLKKRDNASSLLWFREAGFLPESVVNYLALLGWSPKDGREFMSVGELIRKFSPDRCSKSSSLYDMGKLRFLNAHHLRQAAPERLYELCRPFLENAGYRMEDGDRAWWENVLICIRGNVETLTEMTAYLPIFTGPLPPLEEEARQMLVVGQAVVEVFRKEVEQTAAPTEEAFKQIVKRLKSELGVSGKSLFMPLRVAMTGMTHGPELAGIFVLLKKEILLERIRSAASGSK
jgi:nondiscriminating glutamyl-tRNA synthetase